MRRRGDLLDRRQRLAAAALLMAFDLPAEMSGAGEQMREAAEVCPGLTVDEVPIGDRCAALLRAKQLIDELVAEAA
jgi:hypothetical protein